MFEVIAGTLIASLAVLGLAYSFGVGRGLIDRYQVARCALSRAELLVDSLSTRSPGALQPGSQTFWVDGIAAGTESWALAWVDDPIDNNPSDPNPKDMLRIYVRVSWQLGSVVDSVGLQRLVLAP